MLLKLSFPSTMSRTRITIDRMKVVLLHAMKNLISRTKVPEGVQDFLQANASACTPVQQGVLRTAYASILAANCPAANGGGGGALPPKPPPKPRALRVRAHVADAHDAPLIPVMVRSRSDADSIASLEPLDEGEHIGVDTAD